LTRLAEQLTAAAPGSQDKVKVETLAKAVSDLANSVR
jgi:hypothetical protein